MNDPATARPTAAPHRRLRPHHLICLRFFRGEGYDDHFVDNLRGVMSDLERMEVRVVDGPDDVCDCCPHLHGDRCGSPGGGEEEVRRIDALALELLGTSPGMSLCFDASGIDESILGAWRRGACQGCDWEDLCVPLMEADAAGPPVAD